VMVARTRDSVFLLCMKALANGGHLQVASSFHEYLNLLIAADCSDLATSPLATMMARAGHRSNEQHFHPTFPQRPHHRPRQQFLNVLPLPQGQESFRPTPRNGFRKVRSQRVQRRLVQVLGFDRLHRSHVSGTIPQRVAEKLELPALRMSWFARSCDCPSEISARNARS